VHKCPYVTFNESEKWQWSKLEYTPAPDGDRKYNLIGYWTVTWPVINDKHKDRKSAGRRNLEHGEQKKGRLLLVGMDIDHIYAHQRQIFYL
jgi:hypothetical protein